MNDREIILETLLLIEQKEDFSTRIIKDVLDKYAYLDAMRKSIADSKPLKDLLRPALTTKIADRELFMKGIDYSYYYEENS